MPLLSSFFISDSLCQSITIIVLTNPSSDVNNRWLTAKINKIFFCKVSRVSVYWLAICALLHWHHFPLLPSCSDLSHSLHTGPVNIAFFTRILQLAKTVFGVSRWCDHGHEAANTVQQHSPSVCLSVFADESVFMCLKTTWRTESATTLYKHRTILITAAMIISRFNSSFSLTPFLFLYFSTSLPFFQLHAEPCSQESCCMCAQRTAEVFGGKRSVRSSVNSRLPAIAGWSTLCSITGWPVGRFLLSPHCATHFSDDC